MDEEAAEFVEPEGAIDVFGWCGEDKSRVVAYRDGGVVCVGFGVVVVESFEVFLELKGGIELEALNQSMMTRWVLIDLPQLKEPEEDRKPYRQLLSLGVFSAWLPYLALQYHLVRAWQVPVQRSCQEIMVQSALLETAVDLEDAEILMARHYP